MRAMTAIAVTAYFTASVMSVGAGLLQTASIAHAVAVISSGQTTDQVIEAGESAESILLDDGTILTLAPGSRVRIERFDYNPHTGEGGLSLRLLSGGIKVTTGQAGRQSPIVVHTEGRSVEVQNATAAIVIDEGVLTATMLFGGQVKVLGTDPLTVFRPGFAAVIPKGGASGEIVRVEPQKVATLIERFSRPRSTGTQIAAIAPSQPGPGQPQRQQQRENRTRDDQQADGVDPRGPIFDKLIGGLASGLNIGLDGPDSYASSTLITPDIPVLLDADNVPFVQVFVRGNLPVQSRLFLVSSDIDTVDQATEGELSAKLGNFNQLTTVNSENSFQKSLDAGVFYQLENAPGFEMFNTIDSRRNRTDGLGRILVVKGDPFGEFMGAISIVNGVQISDNLPIGELSKSFFIDQRKLVSFSSRVGVTFGGQGPLDDGGVGWLYSSPNFITDKNVPEASVEGFIAVDIVSFSPENGVERFFSFGGVAPPDATNEGLPGISPGTAFVYDVRDGLRPDSETSPALRGNGLRRGLTFQGATPLDTGLVVMSRPSATTGANNFIKIDSTLSLSSGGMVTNEQASSISLATGSVGDSTTGLVGGMVGSTRGSALNASTYLGSGVFSQPVVQDKQDPNSFGGNQLGDPIHWFTGNSFKDGEGNTLENGIGFIILGSNNPKDDVDTINGGANPNGELQTAIERPIGDPKGTSVDNSVGDVEFEYLRLASRGVNSEFGGIDGMVFNGNVNIRTGPVRPLTVDTSIPTSDEIYTGFTAAHVEHVFDSLDDGTTLYAIESDDLTLETRANDNRLAVDLPLIDQPLIVNPDDAAKNSFDPEKNPTLSFGGFDDDQTQLSSYVNDSLFGARTNTSKEFNAGIVSGPATGIEICSNCQHVKWGFFFGDLNLQRGEDRRDHVHLGTWVAGKDPTTADRLDQGFTGTLTYSGHMIGNVFGPSSDGNAQLSYTARGNYTQTWDFNSNTNARTLSAEFDGRNYNGSWNRSGQTNGFTGEFASGSLDSVTPDLRNGSLRGGFFGPNAEEVGGRFSISADPRNPEIYDARGVFAASLDAK